MKDEKDKSVHELGPNQHILVLLPLNITQITHSFTTRDHLQVTFLQSLNIFLYKHVT